MEVWKDIEGYEGYYQISNFGRVKSLKRKVWVSKRQIYRELSERILKQGEDPNGYFRVVLNESAISKTFKVHRLVAIHFKENPKKLPFVNHKDENSKNNHYTNLEWCTPKYNANYGTRNKRMAEAKEKTVIQTTLDGIFVREWKSIKELGIAGFNQGNVSSCCLGKRKTHKGYKFYFK